MKRKKSVTRRVSSKSVNPVSQDLDLFEKEINQDVYEVEKWVLARRKFLIKLGLVFLLIFILFIISEFFLTIPV